MGRDRLITGENDGYLPPLRTDTSHRSTTTPLRSHQAYYTTGNVLQVPSDGTMATNDLRLNHGVEQNHSSPSFDTFTEQVNGMRSPSLSHVYPYERARSPQFLGYNGMAQHDPECQYNLDSALLTNAVSRPDARQVSVPIPMTPAIPEHPSRDGTRSFMPTQAHRNPTALSQSPPSSRLEGTARSLVAPTPTTVNMAVRLGYPYIISSQSLGARDRQSGMAASRPSPYPNPNVSASGMLQSWNSDGTLHTIHHPDPGLQRHIQRHRQYGNRKSTLKSGNLCDEPLYAHPTSTHAKGRVPESFLPDGQNNDSSRRHASLGSNGRPYEVPISIPPLEGASGQFRGPTLPLGATHGHPSLAMGSPLSTYYGSATTANKMWRTQPSSPPHIQRHHQSDNRNSAFHSTSGSGEPFYAPRPLYVGSYGAPSSAHAFTDGHDLPHHASLESSHSSDGVPFPIPMNIGPTSGSDRGSMFQPFENPGSEVGVVVSSPLSYSGRNILVDKPSRPQFTPQVHAPAYIGRGQAPPETIHTEGNDNIPASSLAFSNGPRNYSLQSTEPWGSFVGPSTSTIPTRARTYPSYGQYHHRELLPFTSPGYQSDQAISAASTRSFPDSRLDDVRSPQFNPQGQPSDNPPPSPMSPVRHGTPRQHTSLFTSSHPDLYMISPGLGCTMDEGHSASSSLALADEGRNNSAVTPTTYPSTTFNAQERLVRALGPSSPLKNKALIKLLLLIFESPFFLTQEMEPTIDSEDGQALLGQIQQIDGCPPNAFHVSRDSIFTLFVASGKFRCLICGKLKQSMVRVIGCVRSHLDHRPYPCRGEGGCETCPKDNIVKRFFTASLLHDHCNRQERETKCTSCKTTLTSSMKRHWDAKHPDTPFPYEYYPNYHKE